MNNKILYIDDEPINLEGFVAVFWSDFDIVTATSTAEAEKLLSDPDIKIIISDQRMPNETGLQFFKRVRDIYPDLVFMILTAYADMGLVLEAINQGGIYRYMIKPWDTDEMRVNIQNAIAHYDLRNTNKKLVENLAQSELRYKNITDTITDYLYEVEHSPEQQNITWKHNDNCAKIFGYQAHEFDADSQLWLKTIYEPDRNEVITFMQQTLQQHHSFDIEHRIIHKDGSIRWINNTVIAKNPTKSNNIFDAVIKDITNEKQHQQDIINAVFNAEEKERTSFAREMHDGIGPQLSILNMYLQETLTENNNTERTDIIQKSMQVLSDTMQLVVEISHAMSPHILQNYGLTKAIQSFCKKIQTKHTPNINFSCNCTRRYDKKVELSLYRVVTELVNNTLKYAKASEIQININETDTHLEFSYSDNGIGFTPPKTFDEKQGMGTFNLKNRIELLNGTFILTSAPTQGMSVHITLPI